MLEPSTAQRGATVTMCRWLPSGNAHLTITSSVGRWDTVLMPPRDGQSPKQWKGRVRGLQSADADVVAELYDDRLHVQGWTFIVSLGPLRKLIETNEPTAPRPKLVPDEKETATPMATTLPRTQAEPDLGPVEVPGVQPVGLTVREIEALYGLSPGPIHKWTTGNTETEYGGGELRIRKLGTDGKANRILCHADVLRCLRDGQIQGPRQKQNTERTREWVAERKLAIERGLAALQSGCRHIAGTLRTYTTAESAAVLDLKAPEREYGPIHPLVTFAEAVIDEAGERADDPVWRIFGRMAERALGDR